MPADIPSPADFTYDAFLCRYDEIAMKGKNRRQFERQLSQNLLQVLSPLGQLRTLEERGRIFLLPPKGTTFSVEDCDYVREAIQRVFGLSSISPGFMIEPTLPAIEAAVCRTFPSVYETTAAAHATSAPIAYAMRARRSNRQFPMTSNELEIHFAEKLLDLYPRLTVNLKKPTLCLQVEVRSDRAFVFYDRIPGPGGMPGGSAGKLIALLSGGIDSPVACHSVMRRGCNLHYVTFHSAPYTPPATLEKATRLARALNRYQKPGRLFAVNLLPAQKAIRDNCSPRFRTILYRRMMMRIATIIADFLQAKGLVTGDCIGQVASQTLQNMGVISQASGMMILRPLLGLDKVEVVEKARKIGTYDISKEECADSCTIFAPPSPATSAPLGLILKEEQRLDISGLIDQCLEMSTAINAETLSESPLSRILEFYRQSSQA